MRSDRSDLHLRPRACCTDDYLATTCSFSLVVLLLCSLMFKIGTLTELDEISDRMSVEQTHDYAVNAVALTFFLLAVVFGTFLLSGTLLIVRLAQERGQISREELKEAVRKISSGGGGERKEGALERAFERWLDKTFLPNALNAIAKKKKAGLMGGGAA